jgi:hypothetical protein
VVNAVLERPAYRRGMTLTSLAMLVLQVSPIHPTAAQWGEHLLIADGDGTVRA